MNFTIRPADKNDLYGLKSLEDEVFTPSWSLNSIEGHLAGPLSVSLVAETLDEGHSSPRLIGYLLGTAVCDEAEVCRVAADPSFRRQGIGTALLDAFFTECRKRGAQHFYLDMRAGNAAALALYEKLGFERIAIRKNYYREPVEDAFVMRFEI